MKKINRIIERFGEWSLEKFPLLLFRISLLLTLVIVLVQVTMWQTRKTEREAIVQEQAENGALIDEMREKIDALESEIATREEMAKIIECESGGRHDGIWGDGGRAYGITQIHKGTFYELAGKAEIKGLDWKNKHDQITLLRWALEHGYGDHWTCYRKLTKG